MEVSIFNGIGDFRFDDDFDAIKAKSSGYSVKEVDSLQLGKRYKTLFIEELEILMTFDLAAENVDYFEVNPSCPLTIDGMDVFTTSLGELREHFLSKDPEMEISDDGFLSNKLGLGIYTESSNQDDDVPNALVLYKKGYLENQPSEEELDEYYLGDLDDFMDTEDLNRFGEDFVNQIRDVVIDEYLLVKSGAVKSDNAKLFASFDSATKAEVDRMMIDLIYQSMSQVALFFEESNEWTISEPHNLHGLDYDRTKALKQFLPDFNKKLESALTAFLPQQENIRKFMADFMLRTLQQVAVLFDEDSFWVVVRRSLLEGTDKRHILGMGKSLSGELPEWVQQFSRYQSDSTVEKEAENEDDD